MYNASHAVTENFGSNLSLLYVFLTENNIIEVVLKYNIIIEHTYTQIHRSEPVMYNNNCTQGNVV